MNRFERRTGSADSNEAEIVEALQNRGATVLVLDRPVDLVVGYAGRWVLVEVKSSPSASIRAGQSKFLERCLLNTLPCYLISDIKEIDEFFPIDRESASSGVV